MPMYSLELLLDISGLKRSTYYENRKKIEEGYDKYMTEKEAIMLIYDYSNGFYGGSHITIEMNRKGFSICETTVRT